MLTMVNPVLCILYHTTAGERVSRRQTCFKLNLNLFNFLSQRFGSVVKRALLGSQLIFSDSAVQPPNERSKETWSFQGTSVHTHSAADTEGEK